MPLVPILVRDRPHAIVDNSPARRLGVRHRPKHAVRKAEQATAVGLEARSRIRCHARGTHAVRPGSRAERRSRERALPPSAKAIRPNTNAAAPPTAPLPVPGPPLAIARFSRPFAAAGRPAPKDTPAVNRTVFVRKPVVERKARIYIRDLLDYERRRDAARHEAINNMARAEMEAGTYGQGRPSRGAEDE
jgi:hypothetical protein